MYRKKSVSLHATQRPLESGGTHSTINCVVIGCFWLLAYQNHAVKAMTGNALGREESTEETSGEPVSRASKQ